MNIQEHQGGIYSTYMRNNNKEQREITTCNLGKDCANSVKKKKALSYLSFNLLSVYTTGQVCLHKTEPLPAFSWSYNADISL